MRRILSLEGHADAETSGVMCIDSFPSAWCTCVNVNVSFDRGSSGAEKLDLSASGAKVLFIDNYHCYAKLSFLQSSDGSASAVSAGYGERRSLGCVAHAGVALLQ